MREPAGNRPRTARGSAAVEVALIVPMLIVLVLCFTIAQAGAPAAHLAKLCDEAGGAIEIAVESTEGLRKAVGRIADRNVQAHGGNISAHNRLGPQGVQGARFTIDLPRGQPPQDDGSLAATLQG